MSSFYVRSTVKTWAELPAVAAIAPFYDTINFEVIPRDDIWFTAEFEPEFDELMTVCGDINEEGLINFIFQGNPGVGDSDLLIAAETAVDEILKQADPTGDLVLGKRYAPEEYSGGTATNVYEVSVSVEYVYRR